MANPWVAHVRAFAKSRGLSYMCAATEPECKSSYQARKDAVMRSKKGMKTVKNRSKQNRKLFGEINVERLRRANESFGMSPEMVMRSENREFYPVINFDGNNAFYQSSLF